MTYIIEVILFKSQRLEQFTALKELALASLILNAELVANLVQT